MALDWMASSMNELVRRTVPAWIRESLLRHSVALVEEDAKFRVGQPTMWGSLQNLSRAFRPGGIIDIGANVGDWSRRASRIFDCPIHMIEAQPALEPSLEATGFPYTLTLLGAEFRAEVPFHISGTGSSVMEEVTGLSEGHISLPMQRLDDLALGLSSPLLIKLDVQGYELEVLSGAPETLKRTEVLLVEVSLLEYNKGQPLMHEVIAWLAQRDFLPFDICGGLRRSSDNALFQTDMIFVRRDSELRAKRKFWPHEE
jgi:FkbM family methyltransferase